MSAIEERRTGERRKRDGGPDANDREWSRSGADRRSPGGAGLADQSQARVSGGSAAGLVDRLAALYKEEVASEVMVGSMPRPDARRWLCAFAAELNEIAAGYREGSSETLKNAAWVVGAYFRREADAPVAADLINQPDPSTEGGE